MQTRAKNAEKIGCKKQKKTGGKSTRPFSVSDKLT